MSLYIDGARKDVDFSEISSDANPATTDVFDLGSADKKWKSCRIAQDLEVGGNLTIQGTTTTIESTTLRIEDKNIELAFTASPTDILADGGGITLKGTTDKTILWKDATDSWDFNQPIRTGNLELKLNTLSSFNTNGDILLSPNGTGKVGVNTTSPSTRLSVIDDSVDEGFNVKHSNLSQGVAIGYRTIKKVATATDSDLHIDAKNAGNLLLQTTATGKVGIGTDSPSSIFHIMDGAKASAGEQVRWNIGTDDGGGTMELATRIFGGAAGVNRYVDIQSVEQGVSVRALTFQPSGGNVGIGTTDPSDKLEIAYANSGNNVPGLSIDSTGSQSVLGFRQGGTLRGYIRGDDVGNIVLVSQGGTQNDIHFRAGDDVTTDMVVLDSGNVGIGTAAPSQRLHLFGGNFRLEPANPATSSNADSPRITFMSKGTDGSDVTRDQEWRVFSKHLNNVGNGDLVFQESSDGQAYKERMVISESGGVNARDGFGTELFNVSTSVFETAATGNEYFSPNQHGNIFGTIFRRYYAIPDAPGTGTTVEIAMGFTLIGRVVEVSGVALNQDSNIWQTMPFVDFGSSARNIELQVNSNTSKIRLIGGSGQDWQAGGFICLDYTK